MDEPRVGDNENPTVIGAILKRLDTPHVALADLVPGNGTGKFRAFLLRCPASVLPIFVGLMTVLIILWIKGRIDPKSKVFELVAYAFIEAFFVALAILVDHMIREGELRRLWNRTADELRARLSPIEPHVDPLLHLFAAPQRLLTDYIRSSVATTLVDMQALIEGRAVQRPYAEQISIAAHLTKGTKKRFWATSRDRPSRLWEEGVAYFSSQAQQIDAITTDPGDSRSNIAPARPPEGPPPYARVVLLDLTALIDDYSNYPDLFAAFVEWHAQHGFDLRFDTRTDDEIVDRFHRTITHHEPLQDFLIKDDELVYGRTRMVTASVVELKYLPKESAASSEAFESYVRLFENIWRVARRPDEMLKRVKDQERSRTGTQACCRGLRSRVCARRVRASILRRCMPAHRCCQRTACG